MGTKSWGAMNNVGLSKDAMPDGLYEVRIHKWGDREFKKDEQDGIILDLTMELVGVPDGSPLADKVGEKWKESWWLTRPQARKIFLDELKAVGFDVDSWGTDGLQAADMAPLAVKYAKLRGLTLLLKRFADKSGKYGNLRLAGKAGAGGVPDASTIPNDAVLSVRDEPEDAGDVF